MLKYIPYVLMFAVATMIIYGWGLGAQCTRNRISPTCSVQKESPKSKKRSKKISR